MYQKIRSFFVQSVRVWHVLKKPTTYEYTTVAKVSAIGVLLLGLLGFLVSTVIKSFS